MNGSQSDDETVRHFSLLGNARRIASRPRLPRARRDGSDGARATGDVSDASRDDSRVVDIVVVVVVVERRDFDCSAQIGASKDC
jgi:hypothetical protein